MADRTSVEEIYEFFKNQSGEVDVTELKSFVDNDATIKSNCTIFAEKVKTIKNKKTLSKQQFHQYFNQSLKNKQHFQAVFGAFDSDRSGKISKQELTKLLEKYRIYVDPKDLDIMIQMCSENGDSVTKKSLFDFLSS